MADCSGIPEEREFKCGHRFGNFSNYYSFHSCDERLNEIPIKIFRSDRDKIDIDGCNRYILDVGCNEGNLSVSLLQRLQHSDPHVTWNLLGLELDPMLTERARNKYKDIPNATFESIDVMEEGFDEYYRSYCSSRSISSFDVVCCFSTTMWVHLNHGDEGLQHFLNKLCNSCTSILIIEPQKWKSYKTAVERCRRQRLCKFPQFSTLSWRGSELDDRIVEHVCNNGSFELQRKSTCSEDIVAADLMYWGRSILVFKSKTTLDQSSVL